MTNAENQAEQWRPLPGWEASHEVSSMGRVRTLGRLRWTPGLTRKGRFPHLEWTAWRGRILAPDTVSHYRHLRVQLFDGTRNDIILVSHAVLLAFVGPCPEGMEACHYDCDAGNNALKNLRWDTRQANRQDSIRAGTIARGSRAGGAKLTEAQIPLIRALATKKSSAAVAREFGVGRATISRIWRREAWCHVPEAA